ncbi:MAG: rhomboid family intramembrane serine protease, partial [Verrucomicrobiota bacterium]
MTGGHSSEDRGPWFAVAGHPVNAPLALVGACVVSMLVTTAALAFNHSWEAQLEFSSTGVWRGEVWRVLSYVLWNSPARGLSLALDMLMLWWFGRELENYFGRSVFLKLCAGIALTPALAGLLLGPLLQADLHWVGLPGTFALFVAFATMAPEVTLIFGVSAKWTAVIFLGLQLLSCVASHAWGEFINSLSAASFAFGYIRYQQGNWVLPEFRFPNRRPKLRVLEPQPSRVTVQKNLKQIAKPSSTTPLN